MDYTGDFPFGNPEGARAEIDDIVSGFVSFGRELGWLGLATREDDLRARLFIGHKGSGKTVYLRRVQAYAASSKELFATTLEQIPPGTELVIKNCQSMTREDIIPQWTRIWIKSLIRSTATLLAFDPQLSTRIPADLRVSLLQLARELGHPRITLDVHVPVYRELESVLQHYTTTNLMREYLGRPEWVKLEDTLHRILLTIPPVCIFLDGIDEHFEYAPSYWMHCQLGLFYAIMQLLRDQRLGGRLHIFACIRNVVFLRVLQGEHASRYRDEPHIRHLDWNGPAIRHFLREKIARLPDEHFVDRHVRTLPSWLGMERIENTARGRKEDAATYLLRHTRLSPRDVVTLGNRLCNGVFRARTYDGDVMSTIRQCVNLTAKGFGDEQFIICARQYSTDSLPRGAMHNRYHQFYTGSDEYLPSVVTEFKDLVKAFEKDHFTPVEVDRVKSSMGQFFSSGDPLSVLWQNRLLGYVNPGDRRQASTTVSEFCSAAAYGDFHLPHMNGIEYVLHSIVIDTLGIKAVGHPVVDRSLLEGS